MNYRKPSVKSVQLETWTSPEVKNYVNKNGLAIIPLGSFEQHGPHAPLGTDTFLYKKASRKTELLIVSNWDKFSDNEEIDSAVCSGCLGRP